VDQSETATAAPGKVAVMRDFLVDTQTEMQKVSWPSKPELIKATRAVIIGSIVLGIAIGVVDKLLSLILVDGVAALTR
jgi:preprotein translocase SecE subunit